MRLSYHLRRPARIRPGFYYWCLAGLAGLVLCLAAKPLLGQFILLPNMAPDRHGLSLELSTGQWPWGDTYHSQLLGHTLYQWDRPHTKAVLRGFWLVRRAGVYRLRFTCDDAGTLRLDQKPLIRTWGMHRANGGNAALYLEPGPHFIDIEVLNAPQKGRLELTAKGPGEAEHRILGPEDLAPLDLGNAGFWLGLRDVLRVLGLILLIAGLFMATYPWLTAGARRVLPLLLPRKRSWPAACVALAGLAAALWAWPLARNWVILPSADLNRHGFMVREYLDRGFQGGVVKTYQAPNSIIKLERPQSSLKAWTLWQAPEDGVYAMQLNADQAGCLRLDRELKLLVPERQANEGEPDRAKICVSQGPRLLMLSLNNYDYQGQIDLNVFHKGKGVVPLTGEGLIYLDLPDLPEWLALVTALEYLGLLALAWGLTALGWRLWAPQAWREAALAEPWAFGAAGLALTSFGCLSLRIAFQVDLSPPADWAFAMALVGVVSSLAAAVLAGARIFFPGKQDSSWAFGLAALALVALGGCLRLVFLTNMEYQPDEEGMWRLATNLVRDHIPYLVGNVSSKGNRNPAGFLYLLGLPAALGRSALWGGFFTAILNTSALGLTLFFVRRHLGPACALACGLLVACSPWAIRFSCNIWPQNLLFFFTMTLMLLLPGWVQKGGVWRSMAVGLCASLLVQLHFTGGLLLGGLALAWLAGGREFKLPKVPNLLLALAAFLLLWTPYLYYLLEYNSAGGQAVAKVLAKIPGDSLGQFFSAARLLASGWLDDIGTIGHLSWQFKALLWDPLTWPRLILPVLAACGLYVYAFRLPPKSRADETMDWFRLFFRAALFALIILMVLDERHKMHYVEFLLPWPMILVGLWVRRLGQLPFPAALRRGFLTLSLALILLLSCLNIGFFLNWQSFIARCGGGGEYHPPFFAKQARECCFIQTTRPLPDNKPPRAF